jgi:multidrug efflux pump subunit AcrB
VLIVIIVLIFAMGFRSGLIIGFGLVLTICLSFPILLEMGTTLQRISLGAFIIAMGMLVDNAIVIMDGILVDRAKGLPASTYLYRIGKQTAMPLLGATIIGASTFICIYMTPGSTGEYAGDLFLVLCVSLLVSWALALVQVPVCAHAFLPKREESGEQKEPMSGKFYFKHSTTFTRSSVSGVEIKNIIIKLSTTHSLPSPLYSININCTNSTLTFCQECKRETVIVITKSIGQNVVNFRSFSNSKISNGFLIRVTTVIIITTRYFSKLVHNF